MTKPDCTQLISERVEVIASALKRNVQELSDKIVSCCYCCFKEIFINWAVVMYQHYPEDTVYFLAENAFTDGILKFREAAAKGLYESNASLKTVLFSFYKNKLREHFQNEKRLINKKQELASVYKEEEFVDNKEQLLYESRYLFLEETLSKMEETDRNIILWRHIEGASNETIAARLNITVPSATNRIYRCMQRLKQLTEQKWN